jgi:raffinose/stachyose/melibiose transport system substrate-binding protein
MKNNLQKIIGSLLLIVSVLVSLVGCSTKQESASSNKVTITISYSSQDITATYLTRLKEKFIDLDIQLVNRSFESSSGNADYSFLEYLSSHGGLADIVLDSNLSKSLPSLTEAFADLSGESYSSRVRTSYLNDIQIDGSLYYLPFTVEVKGLIYNKTMFEEYGWEAPTDYASFARLLQTIAQTSDIRPMYDDATYKTVEYWWNTFYALNEGTLLSGHQALKQFNAGTLSALELPTENTFAFMKLLTDTGSLIEEDLATYTGELKKSTEAFRALARGETAMAFAPSSALKNLSQRNSQSEYVMLPIYSPNCAEGYLIEDSNMNIAVSKAASEDPEKAAAINRIMDYITSEEGQQLLLEFSYGTKSPCYGIMDTDSRDFLKGILPSVNSGYIITPEKFENLGSTLDETFLNYLFHNESGSLQPTDVLRAMDSSRSDSLVTQQAEEEILTTVEKTMTKDETKYLLCKAMADETGSDFAVLPNMQYNNYNGSIQQSESLMTNLLAGTLSTENIHGIINYDSLLKTYELTGTQLLKLLDYNTSEFMLYGATLTYTYNKDKDTYYTTGATMPDGSALDESKTYTLAASAHSELGQEISALAVDTDLYLSDALIAYCKEEKQLAPIIVPEPNYKK